MGDFIIAASGGLVIFVALFGAAQVLDNVFHYTDKTLEKMENKKKPACEADQNEQVKYNTFSSKSQAGKDEDECLAINV